MTHDDDGDIMQSTKSVLHGLDALRSEHEKLLQNISPTNRSTSTKKTDDKLGLLQKSMDMIELGRSIHLEDELNLQFSLLLQLGIGEAEVMMQLGLHLQNFEAEKQKLRTQVKRLCQENAWLRDELGSTQKKLHECEQTNASYAVEIEHLKFLKNIQQFDDTSLVSGNPADDRQQQDLVNDLFPFDENEEDQPAENGKAFTSYNDLSMSTSHIASGSFLSSTGYEIPARLKTLHNLVIQYASQGRYEVAVPLCRQALTDLEKSSGHQRKRNSEDVRLGIPPGNFIDDRIS